MGGMRSNHYATLLIGLHSTTKLINGIVWFFNKKLMPDLKCISPSTSASDLKLKRLLLICGTRLYL